MIDAFRIRAGGRAGIWLAGAVFAAVGLGLVLAAPTSTPWGPDHPTDRMVFHVLGGFFLTFGVLILGAMVWGSARGSHDPGLREELGWWVNFLGGVVGAAAFSLPATLALPVFLFAYSRRPNALFPAGKPASGSLLMASGFSALGLLGLLLTIFFVRTTLRRRRHGVRHRTNGNRSRQSAT